MLYYTTSVPDVGGVFLLLTNQYDHFPGVLQGIVLTLDVLELALSPGILQVPPDLISVELLFFDREPTALRLPTNWPLPMRPVVDEALELDHRNLLALAGRRLRDHRLLEMHTNAIRRNAHAHFDVTALAGPFDAHGITSTAGILHADIDFADRTLERENHFGDVAKNVPFGIERGPMVDQACDRSLAIVRPLIPPRGLSIKLDIPDGVLRVHVEIFDLACTEPERFHQFLELHVFLLVMDRTGIEPAIQCRAYTRPLDWNRRGLNPHTLHRLDASPRKFSRLTVRCQE